MHEFSTICRSCQKQTINGGKSFSIKGESAEFFGREYRIHSCDDFTRGWLRSEGVQLGPASADGRPPSATPAPGDAPTKTRAQAAFERGKESVQRSPRHAHARVRPKSAAPRLSNDNAAEERPGQKLRKYLENDGKVLR